MFLAVQIMMTYDFSLMIVTCIGLAFGNFTFGGICQDQVIISSIKRQLKIQKIINTKISLHNNGIQRKCMQGKMTLIKDHQDVNQMSLEKISNELQFIQNMDPDQGGEMGQIL